MRAMRLRPSGLWEWDICSRGGVVLERGQFPNGVTLAGRNLMGNVMFRGTAAEANWYAGLIDQDAFDAVAEGDTSSSHAGWTENEDYDEATRVQWSPAASASGILRNATLMTFTASALTRVQGAFLISVSTKGGTTGTLYCTGLFDVPRLLEKTQALRLRYIHTLAG